ncbi:hypothetical protein LX36DRAFT_74973 [Colletotrichum falcatum]|nr:hypothetical protein LX36DRAFT_74973 [Colletotrichum falcatum]
MSASGARSGAGIPGPSGLSAPGRGEGGSVGGRDGRGPVEYSPMPLRGVDLKLEGGGEGVTEDGDGGGLDSGATKGRWGTRQYPANQPTNPPPRHWTTDALPVVDKRPPGSRLPRRRVPRPSGLSPPQTRAGSRDDRDEHAIVVSNQYTATVERKNPKGAGNGFALFFETFVPLDIVSDEARKRSLSGD